MDFNVFASEEGELLCFLYTIDIKQIRHERKIEGKIKRISKEGYWILLEDGSLYKLNSVFDRLTHGRNYEKYQFTPQNTLKSNKIIQISHNHSHSLFLTCNHELLGIGSNEYSGEDFEPSNPRK